MDSKKSSKPEKGSNIDKPDIQQGEQNYKLKAIESEGSKEEPKVFKVVRRGNEKDSNTHRRSFLKNSAKGFSGLLAIGGILAGCEDSTEILIEATSDQCTCHTVCTCDTVTESSRSEHNAIWTSRTVCTCNTVCTCDTVSTGSGGSGGGGGSYWYPN